MPFVCIVLYKTAHCAKGNPLTHCVACMNRWKLKCQERHAVKCQLDSHVVQARSNLSVLKAVCDFSTVLCDTVEFSR